MQLAGIDEHDLEHLKADVLYRIGNHTNSGINNLQ